MFNRRWDGGGGGDSGGGGAGNLGPARRGGGGEGRAWEPTGAANDWFAATRHGRDDPVSRGIRPSNKGPGWEDTFAYKRSTARRAVQTSKILSGKVLISACFVVYM